MAWPDGIGEHVLRHGDADLQAGFLIEPVVHATVNAGERLLLDGLPESVVMSCDLRQPTGYAPHDCHGDVVGAREQLKGAGGAGANRRQIAGV